MNRTEDLSLWTIELVEAKYFQGLNVHHYLGVHGCEIEVVLLVPLARVPEFLVLLWEHDITLAPTYHSSTPRLLRTCIFQIAVQTATTDAQQVQNDIKGQKGNTWALHHAISTFGSRDSTLIAPDTDVGPPTSGFLGRFLPGPHGRW